MKPPHYTISWRIRPAGELRLYPVAGTYPTAFPTDCGDFIDRRGSITIYRTATWTSLELIHQGREERRVWKKRLGDRLIRRACRQMLTDFFGT